MLGSGEKILVQEPSFCPEGRSNHALPLDPSEGHGHRLWLFLRKEEFHKVIGTLDVMSCLFLEESKSWLDGVPEIGLAVLCRHSLWQGLGGLSTKLRYEGRAVERQDPLPSLDFCGPGAALLPAPPSLSATPWGRVPTLPV